MARQKPMRSQTIIGMPGQGTHSRGNWQSDRAIDIAGGPKSTVKAITYGWIEAPRGSAAIRNNGEGWPIFGYNIYLREAHMYVGWKWNNVTASRAKGLRLLGASVRLYRGQWQVWNPGHCYRKTNRYWFYTHTLKPSVKSGQFVKMGQKLAPGVHANGGHLHLGCSFANPYSLLKYGGGRSTKKPQKGKNCPGQCRI